MTRAALRKAQHNLFDAGPAACMAPRAKAAAVNEVFDPGCEAPGCGAKACFGFGSFVGVRGIWFCNFHKHLGSAAA